MDPKRQKIEVADAIANPWLVEYLCIALGFDTLAIRTVVSTFGDDYRIAARARRIYTEWVQPLKRELGLENHPLLLGRTARSPFALEFFGTSNPAVPAECTSFGHELNVHVSRLAASESWVVGQQLGQLTSVLLRMIKERLTTLRTHNILAASLGSRPFQVRYSSNSAPPDNSYVLFEALVGEHAVTVKCYSFHYRVIAGFRKASCPLDELEMSVTAVARYESDGELRTYGCRLGLDCSARKVVPACMVHAVNGHKISNIPDVILGVADGYLEHAAQLTRYSVPVQ